ncbi:MAG: hypothetical protein U0V72_01285 [Cytophagales bacterium]
MTSFSENQNEKQDYSVKHNIYTPDGYKRCIEIINLILDGEATQEQVAYFEGNIKCCEKSMEFYNIEKCVRDAVVHKLRYKSVPKDLLDCVKKSCNCNDEPKQEDDQSSCCGA